MGGGLVLLSEISAKDLTASHWCVEPYASHQVALVDLYWDFSVSYGDLLHTRQETLDFYQITKLVQ